MDSGIKKEFLELRKSFLEREFSKINSKQSEAVFYVNGPLMILAGAGSGKTTVIVNRIANMINYGDAYMSSDMPDDISKGTLDTLKLEYDMGESAFRFRDLLCVNRVAPWNILAITFTNKAANELKERILSIVGEVGKDVWASTFHSMCARILRIDGDKLGYSNHFTIYDSDDSKKLIKECQRNLKIDEKMLPFKYVLSEISSAKNRLVDHNKFKEDSGDDFRLGQMAQIYERYQKHLIESDAMDFDDLIMNTVKLFREYPEVLKKYQGKFKYILVDEFQDTNHTQNALINIIAGSRNNVCIVGDDDQSIYKFRGATIENIMNFENNYPGTKVVRLEQNYRCTKNILEAANSLIKNNAGRKDKTLWTENPEGEKIGLHTAYSEHDEADYIAQTVKEKVECGARYSDFAVLYRMNSQSNVIEKIFMRSGIPYRILGGTRFYERREIKDMIAYLSVINNPQDEVRLRRIINQPRRSIGERTISQIAEIAEQTGLDMMEIIKNASDYEQLQRVACKLEMFFQIMDGLMSAYREKRVSLRELYQMIIDKTDYIQFLHNDKEDCQSRIENIQELMNNIVKYEEDSGDKATLSGFLEEISLLTDIDNYDKTSDSVVMMTMHSAKGLEFPVVFLPGFEEGIFPGAQSEFDDSEIEEERRLAYVGITRAKEKLYILNSGSRMVFGSTSNNKCSRFINEIPQEIIERSKSRDWKKMDPTDEKPQSAQEIRVKSAIAARHFGQLAAVSGGLAPPLFDIGDKVMHGKFGTGTIIASVNMDKCNDVMLEIDFDNDDSPSRKIMSKFARLNKLN